MSDEGAASASFSDGAGRGNVIETVSISSCVTKYEDEDKKKKK